MYGLENDLEEILQAHPELFPRGSNWEFRWRQHRLTGGRADLIFQTGKGRYAVVEVKRGQASVSSVDQVLAYAQDMRCTYPVVQPWVAAHVITPEVRERAKQIGVKVIAVDPAAVAHLGATQLQTHRTVQRRRAAAPFDSSSRTFSLLPAHRR